MTADPTSAHESLWTRPRRGARGPEPEHTLGEVAEAAIRVASRGGVAAASMRSVAAELGSTAGGLYRYVASRDELLDLMVDTAMAGFTFAHDPAAEWIAEMARLGAATRALYLAHPWILDARPARSTPGPHTLMWFEHCLQAMEPLDLPQRRKLEVIGVFNGIITMFAQSALAPAAFAFTAVDGMQHPRLTAALAASVADASPDDLLERTIRAALRGLLG